MAGVHDSIPVFYAQNEKKFFENATVGVGFLALNRTHMVGKMPPLEREKVHGKAEKPCKYVLFEADIFPTPTVVVLPVLS